MPPKIHRLHFVAFFTWLVLLHATSSRAAILDFQLSEPSETENRLVVSVKPGGLEAVSQPADVTGLMKAELGLQLVGSKVVVTGITLKERRLEFSDLLFVYSGGLFTINGEGLGGAITTIDAAPLTPPSAVTNSQFDGAEQQLTIDQGVFTPSFGDPQDMSEVPFSSPSSGTGEIVLVETGRIGSQISYQVVLTVPVVLDGFVQAEPLPVTMQVDGTLRGMSTWMFYGADFDHDLDVDGGDFLSWQRGVGLPGMVNQPDGDANLDGQVEALDLAAWQGQWGTSPTESLSAFANVPEPDSVVLALLVGSLLLPGYRRRCQVLDLTRS